MTGVLDYSAARPNPYAVKQLGFDGLVRYIGPYRNDGVIITGGEYQAIRSAGLALALVMEYSAAFLMNGYAWCKQMADGARQQEAAMGIPVGVTYGACDWDVTLGGPPQSAQALDNCKRSLDGLHGMADGLGGWQYARPYGSKWFCEWACANSPMTGSWSTQAWSWVPGVGFVPATNATLFQRASWPAGVPYVDGCDYNDVRGNWAPRGIVVPPVGPIPIVTGGDLVAEFRQINLNVPDASLNYAAPPLRTVRGLLEAWGVKVDGRLITPNDTNSDRTKRAVKGFQQAMGLTPDLVVGEQTYAKLCLALTR